MTQTERALIRFHEKQLLGLIEDMDRLGDDIECGEDCPLADHERIARIIKATETWPMIGGQCPFCGVQFSF